jgi:hypothetical protein
MMGLEVKYSEKPYFIAASRSFLLQAQMVQRKVHHLKNSNISPLLALSIIPTSTELLSPSYPHLFSSPYFTELRGEFQ